MVGNSNEEEETITRDETQQSATQTRAVRCAGTGPAISMLQGKRASVALRAALNGGAAWPRVQSRLMMSRQLHD